MEGSVGSPVQSGVAKPSSSPLRLEGLSSGDADRRGKGRGTVCWVGVSRDEEGLRSKQMPRLAPKLVGRQRAERKPNPSLPIASVKRSHGI